MSKRLLSKSQVVRAFYADYGFAPKASEIEFISDEIYTRSHKDNHGFEMGDNYTVVIHVNSKYYVFTFAKYEDGDVYMHNFRQARDFGFLSESAWIRVVIDMHKHGIAGIIGRDYSKFGYCEHCEQSYYVPANTAAQAAVA